MLQKRSAQERGQTSLSWLDGRHSFSFGNYYDPQHMSFRSLRVMNEDHIAPTGGFGTHPHQNMEIITYVMNGSLTHQDSEGNKGSITGGEIQFMRAGTGIQHSEFNHSQDQEVHLYQIWVEPKTMGLQPHYEQRKTPVHNERNTLHLLASPDSVEGVVQLDQDLKLLAGAFDKGKQLNYTLASDRHAWIQVVAGKIQVNDITLNSSDGLAISDEDSIELTGLSDFEILLFDLV